MNIHMLQEDIDDARVTRFTSDYATVTVVQQNGGATVDTAGVKDHHCDDDDTDLYNAAIDGAEAFLLALAATGMPMDQSIGEAFFTAVEGVANNV